MRFRLQIEVCVEAATVEELHELESRAGDAVLGAVGDNDVTCPDGEHWGSTRSALDGDAQAALDAEPL